METTPSPHEEFMRLYLAAEPKLRAFAFSCGLSREQVDDLAQQAALTLWRRIDTYDRSRPFLPWALGVAHHLIQEARRDAAQTRRTLSPDVAVRVASTAADLEGEIDLRRGSLRRCVGKLPEHLRALLALRYKERLALSEIAKKLNKGLSAVNMSLHRIRQMLLECVEREEMA